MDASSRERYQGKEKLLISIDLGTTMSAVAYTHLFPGSIPQVRMVNRWPGQEEAAGDSKIPSLVAYEGSRPIAFGANALEHAGVDGVFLAKWFKLHLHPDSMKVSNEPPAYGSATGVVPTFEVPPCPATFEIPPLPRVSLKKIYADLLGYLFDHAREFFKNNTVDGTRIWTRLGQQVTICLATPNGWETSQQAFLREACILGGLLPESHDESRLRFVTEGEASVHYALCYTQPAQWLRKGAVFAVVDAGGSTVDSTLYKCKETTPELILEEACPSECVQAGSVFIDRAAQHVLEAKLRGSRFGDDACIQGILGEFERKTKRKFDGTQVSSIIKFGMDWDSDREHGVWKGRITLTKDEVERAFNEVVPRIESSCLNLISGRKVEHLILVGGFGESPYLRRRLKETFVDKGINIVTVDEPTKKAAAEGAAIWYIKHLVVARVARNTLGVRLEQTFNPNNPVHLEKQCKCYVDIDGTTRVTGLFATWVKKNAVIGANMSKVFNYKRRYNSLHNRLGDFSVNIYAYDGEGDTDWADDESGNLLPSMRRVCTLKADLSGLRNVLKVQKGPNDQDFWVIEFMIDVRFGGTTLKASMKWYEGALLRHGPISIIPNSVY